MITLKDAFLKKYPRYGIILTSFEKANDCPAEWENLTKLKLINFVEYLIENIAKSSTKTYCAMLKSVINMYNEETEIPCRDYEKILSVKNEKSTQVWLSEQDIERLIKRNPASDTEQLVKAQFLIGCYTGARHSDYTRFSETNIQSGMLSYVSIKTKTQATVPLKPIVLELLKEVSEGRTVSDHKFNDTIRELCRKSGINERVKVFRAGKEMEGEKWEFVSSHTARRSFCTNLYLLGADLYSISKMAGHSSITMTEGYICVGLKKQPVEVMKYFE